MTAAVFDLARCSSATIVLLVSDAQAVLRSMAGDVSGSFAQPADDSLPSFPLGAKAHRGIIHIEGEAP
jgi:hypothetical protein